jgi:hypothetical protein
MTKSQAEDEIFALIHNKEATTMDGYKLINRIYDNSCDGCNSKPNREELVKIVKDDK